MNFWKFIQRICLIASVLLLILIVLKLKQEKLQEDPRFIEKIAREDLGYAKPGETVFRFVDEEAP